MHNNFPLFKPMNTLQERFFWWRELIGRILLTIVMLPFLAMILMIMFLIGSVIIGGIEKDITNYQRVKNISGKTFELQKDTFLYECPYTKNHKISPAGSELVPPSLEAYLNDPIYWGLTNGCIQVDILGVIREGTKITVDQIFSWNNYETGDHYRFSTTIHNDEFKYEHPDAQDLFEINWLDDDETDYIFLIDESIAKDVNSRNRKLSPF